MPEARWKRHERQVAQALGGRRLPNTGRRGPDVVAGPWAVEVKLRRSLPQWLLLAIAQAEEGARATGRQPLVVLVEAPGGGGGQEDTLSCPWRPGPRWWPKNAKA